MIYQLAGDWEEEIKSLSLALRKFPIHPLVGTLEEHIIFRLNETSKKDRLAAYAFALIVLVHLSHRITKEILSAITNLTDQLEHQIFFDCENLTEEEFLIEQILILAFWLQKPFIIQEVIEKRLQPDQHTLIESALYTLLHLGEANLVKELSMGPFPFDVTEANFAEHLDQFFKVAPLSLSIKEIKAVFYMFLILC